MSAIRKSLATLSVPVLLLTACGTERSVEAFCGTLSSEKERILAQFEATSQPNSGDQLVDALAGLGASVQALGELRTYFNKLAEVAPEEIRVDTELVAQHFEKQFDQVSDMGSNPLGQLAGSLFGAMAISGQMNTVQEFAMENCGEGI